MIEAAGASNAVRVAAAADHHVRDANVAGAPRAGGVRGIVYAYAMGSWGPSTRNARIRPHHIGAELLCTMSDAHLSGLALHMREGRIALGT